MTFFVELLSTGDNAGDTHQTFQDLLDVSDVPFEIVRTLVSELVSDWWTN